MPRKVRRAKRGATGLTGGTKPMICASNKEKAEESSTAQRLPCLEGLVVAEFTEPPRERSGPRKGRKIAEEYPPPLKAPKKHSECGSVSEPKVASPVRECERKRAYKTVVFAPKFRKVRGEERGESGGGMLGRWWGPIFLVGLVVCLRRWFGCG
jgi:hypothetical protein